MLCLLSLNLDCYLGFFSVTCLNSSSDWIISSLRYFHAHVAQFWWSMVFAQGQPGPEGPSGPRGPPGQMVCNIETLVLFWFFFVFFSIYFPILCTEFSLWIHLFQSNAIPSVPDCHSHIMKTENSQALYWVHQSYIYAYQAEVWIILYIVFWINLSLLYDGRFGVY